MQYRTSDFCERRVRAAVVQSGIGIWEHNLATDEVIWNEQMHRLYGHEPIFQPRLASIWVDSLHPEDRERAIAEFEQAAVNHAPYVSRYRIVRTDGQIRCLQSRAVYEISEDGQLRYWGTEWDVTGDNAAEASAPASAPINIAKEIDPITGLPNRLRLYEALRQSVHDVQTLAVAQLDLAEFRNINEEFGFETGDLLLQGVAVVLQNLIEGSASLFRSGSSEFTVLVPNTAYLPLQHFTRAAIEAVQLTAKQLQPAERRSSHRYCASNLS